MRLALCLAVIAASSVCSWTGCGVKKLQTLFVCTLDMARPDYLCYGLHGVASRIVLLWAPRILAACLRRSSIGWLGPGVSTATLCNDFRAACSALPRWLPRWFELPHPNLRLVGPCACPLANPPPPNLREVMGTMWFRCTASSRCCCPSRCVIACAQNSTRNAYG